MDRLIAATLFSILLFGSAGVRGALCESSPPAESPARKAMITHPRTAPLSAELSERLRAALQARGPDYHPRTRHLNADGSPRYTNRLILESSPYLLQHAHNPVNWYPWGDEAFSQAREQGKPVLLSVGYATCHWCHVMEEESFENEEIAGLINRYYIAIKVDREQRPDVDAVYMAAVRRLTGGGGGWPMTVFLTAARRPFYGGTYFPPHGGQGGRPGLDRVLPLIAERFTGDPDQVLQAAADLAGQLAKELAPPPGNENPTSQPLRTAFDHLHNTFDDKHGGFGGAPKFPRPATLEFLLRYYRRSGNTEALDMVERTLEAMARGGIYDHVGGGFHRYSTDDRWLVPHFEKMLYDNAQLAVAYLEGYQATKRPDFAQVARETLRYVAREMTAPEGGFFSATDADSDGEEGKFFVWTPHEIEAALGTEKARLVETYYGVTPAGNFHGASILSVPRPAAQVAAALGIEPTVLARAIAAARNVLYRERVKRPPPLTDRKILVSWNGLMISAFTRAAGVLREPADAREAYLRSATRAADFILSNMRDEGRLHRSAFDGTVTGSGYLDDYAFLSAALLDLYEVTGEPRWLEEAVTLHRVLEGHFWDRQHGGYFTTANDSEALLAREKPNYDGAKPSGNSVAILNLLRLYELTTDAHYLEMADLGLRALSGTLTRAPRALPKLLCALDFRLDRAKTIVIITGDDPAGAEPLLATLGRTFVPNHVLSVVSAGAPQNRLYALVPLVAEKTAQAGRATAYVCENRVCALPTSNPKVFARQLATHAPLPAS